MVIAPCQAYSPRLTVSERANEALRWAPLWGLIIVGLPDSSRHTVHSMYPAAAAITAGILLVGRSRTGICLSLVVALVCASCVCSPLGIKSKNLFIPGAVHHPDREENEAGGRQESNNMVQPAARKSRNRQRRVLLRKFSSSETNLQVSKIGRKRACGHRGEKLVRRFHRTRAF